MKLILTYRNYNLGYGLKIDNQSLMITDEWRIVIWSPANFMTVLIALLVLKAAPSASIKAPV